MGRNQPPGKRLPETWYAKTGLVKVTREKSPTSEMVGTLNYGDHVKVLEKSGSRCRIRVAMGKTGWVFKLKLSEQKPAKKQKGSMNLSKLRSKNTIAPKETRSIGSIRG